MPCYRALYGIIISLLGEVMFKRHQEDREVEGLHGGALNATQMSIQISARRHMVTITFRHIYLYTAKDVTVQ
jgi:hypothetical protein